MSGSVAIETNRVALVRIVASLITMAGSARASHLPPEAGNQGRSAEVGAAAETVRRVGSEPPRAGVLAQEVADGRNDPTRFAPLRGPQRPPHKGEVNGAPTITRHVWRAILSLLRPAEAAARRLIIAAARGIVVPLPPPRKPAPQLKPAPLTARTLPQPADREAFLRLSPARRYVPAHAAPRIMFPGITRPHRLPPPSPDDPVSAVGVARRLAALAAALDDLPKQARRFARLKARLDLQRTQDRDATHPRRFRRTSPLRGGPPYGGRLAVWDPTAPHGKHIREIDEILAHAHALADYALDFPDTS